MPSEDTVAQVGARSESTMREVGESELAIEGASRRLSQAVAEVTRLGADPNVVIALETAIGELDVIRRRLHQGTYLRGAQQRML